MKHPVLKQSKCVGSWLHRFDIVEEYPEGVKEVCQICHKTKFFKIIDDKVDNQSYMDWHIRSALPNQHPLYYHEHHFNADKIESPYVS